MINIERPDFSNTPAAPLRPCFSYSPIDARTAPVVSVITPYYNTDEVFLETVQSVLGQSLQNFEWIIVDDGSTDAAALAQLHAVQASDVRIKVVVQKNAGPAAARNTAVQHSSGRYLCMLDSDDLLEPTFIEKCIWFLESNPDFGFCNTWSVNFGEKNFLWRVGFERGGAHLEANSGPPMSVVRRVAFEAAGGFDESIRLGHEDWDFWLGLAKAGYWGYTLQEFSSWYRQRTSGRFQQVMRAGSAHRDFENLIAKKYAGLRSNFPAPVIKSPVPYETAPFELPFDNRLAKPENVHRILFVIPWMVTGGADKVNLDWVEALTRNGYQVSICATLESDHNWLHAFAKLTPDIFVLPNLLRIADYPRFLRYLIQSRQIDTVLVSASTFGYLSLPYLRAHCPGVAFVDLCHVEEEWMSGGHPRFGVGYQDMLDLNLVTTSHLRDWMVERGAKEDRIEVCYSGIDVAKLDAGDSAKERPRNALGLAAHLPVIVFAGRICDQKRPEFLADILQALAERGVRFQALVIGDGELRPALESKLRAAELMSSVRMMGVVDHDSWLQALAASDIFLLPSKYEGISVALLEAMGMGVVPVTAAVGGQDEVVAPDCGFLIMRSDIELMDYVDALALLLDNEPLRQQMGKAARARILAHFSLAATTETLLAALDRARHMAVSQPRLAITPGLAQEMATHAVEYTRLNKVANLLWSRHGGVEPTQTSHAIPVEGLRRLLGLLSATRIGAALLRNRILRAAGRRLITRLTARQQTSAPGARE